ncbi:MAG: nicotinamide riboside transporter PnuC [Flavobacteriales bacterium]
MDLFLIIEIVSVILGLVYLILLIKQNINCWWFGIAASLLSIFLFYNSKLYSEAILYTYYVFMGFYGYYSWSRTIPNSVGSTGLLISEKGLNFHIQAIGFSSLVAISLAWIFDNFTDASSPYLDAFTTIFSFLATYLEAKKVLSAWIYWIIINGFTIGLYLTKGLDIYSTLFVIYFVMSFVGYVKWKKELV